MLYIFFMLKGPLCLQINLFLIQTKEQELVLKTNNCLKNCTLKLIKKFEKRKVHSPFIDNIPGADLANMLICIY